MQSDRLKRLPPYLFVEIDRHKAEYARSGREVLDLGIGDPDLGAPPELIDTLRTSLDTVEYHRYPSDRGLTRLVNAIQRWALDHYGVLLDNDEILVTIGSKEAIGHLPLAVVNPGDVVLVPDPGYPVYNSSAVFAGAEPVRMPLLKENGYFPDFSEIAQADLKRARLVYLNYPNNPTAATVGKKKFEEAISFCGENALVLVNDAAYSEISYDARQQSLFPLAKEAGIEYIELFSFSKTFSITGWRIGFAIGSPQVISALARLKANVDSGVFSAIQAAAASALETGFILITKRIIEIFRKRRDILAESLEKGGFKFTVPGATFYFWISVPGGGSSIEYCGKLLEETGIVATPGLGFGSHGEGYFRLSITAPDDTILKAGRKLEELGATPL
ncbi:MAG: aminotransferase class I/II-fold pyridoxal phosphate-dependent enzyme [Candidatus Krumholzibacteria bacterium]|nr:aminotransferase class I/II-fold pyridoxal phosphate-dependent enzyme [Candidatus Krumholzibacteria bacterium]